MTDDTLFVFTDFDDTLSKGDSILPFLLFCIREGIAPRRQLLKAAVSYPIGLMLRKTHPDFAKQRTLSFLKGRSPKEMETPVRRFFEQVLVSGFFPEGIKELRKLKEQGYRIVVVSASCDVYMRFLPEYLPVDEVVCTTCIQDKQGLYTGRIGRNCRSIEKTNRIQDYLCKNGLQADYSRCHAYGDSISDAPMLSAVGFPTLVNPKKQLKKALPSARTVYWKTTGKE